MAPVSGYLEILFRVVLAFNALARADCTLIYYVVVLVQYMYVYWVFLDAQYIWCGVSFTIDHAQGVECDEKA
jgi:hypothetical protein